MIDYDGLIPDNYRDICRRNIGLGLMAINEEMKKKVIDMARCDVALELIRNSLGDLRLPLETTAA